MLAGRRAKRVSVCACVCRVLQTLNYLRIVYAREWRNFQERLLSRADVRAALGPAATAAHVKEAAFLPGAGVGLVPVIAIAVAAVDTPSGGARVVRTHVQCMNLPQRGRGDPVHRSHRAPPQTSGVPWLTHPLCWPYLPSVLLQTSPCTSGATSSWAGPACAANSCSAPCMA